MLLGRINVSNMRRTPATTRIPQDRNKFFSIFNRKQADRMPDERRGNLLERSIQRHEVCAPEVRLWPAVERPEQEVREGSSHLLPRLGVHRPVAPPDENPP